MRFDLTPGQWLGDLDALDAGLRRFHRDVGHARAATALDAIVRSIRDRLPELGGQEEVVEFARLVAAVGDGHTALRLADLPGFSRYPLEFYSFAEGLIVRRARPGYERFLGSRIVAIDGRSVHEAWGALRPLVSADNEMGVVATLPGLLAIPEVLHARRLVPRSLVAMLDLVAPDGRQSTVTVSRWQRVDQPWADLWGTANGAGASPAPRPTDHNWFEARPSSGTVYVALNLMRDGSDESLAQFVGRVLLATERPGVERLVLDLRHNGGGDNRLYRPLLHGLVRSDVLRRPGHLFVLIGRRTFSAAMNLAVDLEHHTPATFVGEATGSAPNHFGENHDLRLPAGGIELTIARWWWQFSAPDDHRSWIAPTLPVPERADDYAQGFDRALAVALGTIDVPGPG